MSGNSELTTHWQTCAAPLQDDQALREAVLAVHEDLYQKHFVNLPMINPRLPIEIRAFRRIEQWRVFLLLTPWMLVRVWIPQSVPAIAVPPGWSAAERENASYALLGPALKITIMAGEQKAHLTFDRQIGHYLIQPLVLSMLSYDSAEAVYHAWHRLIQTRNQTIKQVTSQGKWKQEVSRRALFLRLGHCWQSKRLFFCKTNLLRPKSA